MQLDIALLACCSSESPVEPAAAGPGRTTPLHAESIVTATNAAIMETAVKRILASIFCMFRDYLSIEAPQWIRIAEALRYQEKQKASIPTRRQHQSSTTGPTWANLNLSYVDPFDRSTARYVSHPD